MLIIRFSPEASILFKFLRYSISSMITTIIFDLGAVVLTNDGHPEDLDKVEQELSVSDEGYNRAWVTTIPKYRIGKTTEDEFWKEFLQISNSPVDVETAKLIWRKYQKEKESMLLLVKKLNENYKIHALTNIGKEWLEFKKEKFHFEELFDIIVDSANFGKPKPDYDIYKELLTQAQVKPEKCLFIDNMERNLKPARELGFNTILFTDQSQLEKELINLGIKF